MSGLLFYSVEGKLNLEIELTHRLTKFKRIERMGRKGVHAICTRTRTHTHTHKTATQPQFKISSNKFVER